MFPVVTTTSLLLEAILPVQTVYYRRKFWKYKTWRTVVVFFTSLRTITHPSFPLQDFLKFFFKVPALPQNTKQNQAPILGQLPDSMQLNQALSQPGCLQHGTHSPCWPEHTLP